MTDAAEAGGSAHDAAVVTLTQDEYAALVAAGQQPDHGPSLADEAASSVAAAQAALDAAHLHVTHAEQALAAAQAAATEGN